MDGKIRIPDLEGLSEEEAKKKLKELGIKYKEDIKYEYSLKERGKVTKTNPRKNEYYDGKEIEIYESKGFIFLLLPILVGMLILGLVGAMVIPGIMEKPGDKQQEEKFENKEIEINEDENKELTEEDRRRREEEARKAENEAKVIEVIKEVVIKESSSNNNNNQNNNNNNNNQNSQNNNNNNNNNLNNSTQNNINIKKESEHKVVVINDSSLNKQKGGYYYKKHIDSIKKLKVSDPMILQRQKMKINFDTDIIFNKLLLLSSIYLLYIIFILFFKFVFSGKLQKILLTKLYKNKIKLII